MNKLSPKHVKAYELFRIENEQKPYKKLIGIFPSIYRCYKVLGVNTVSIHNVCNKKCKFTKQNGHCYKFKYTTKDPTILVQRKYPDKRTTRHKHLDINKLPLLNKK
jgi:hypothetical protein